MFKRMPKDRQLRVRQVYKILSLDVNSLKIEVNQKFRRNVGGNAI